MTEMQYVSVLVCVCACVCVSHRNGSEIVLFDPRPNVELLLATGTVPDSNPADFLLWDASLIEVSTLCMCVCQCVSVCAHLPQPHEAWTELARAEHGSSQVCMCVCVSVCV